MPILLLTLLVALIVGPQCWIWWVKRRHSAPRDDFPGTGGEFARHLLARLGLADDVSVVRDERLDAYSPRERRVLLSPDHHDQRSLAAVVVAAHEVGHAIQHATAWPPFRHHAVAQRLATRGVVIGGWLMLLALPASLLTHGPGGGMLFALGAFMSIGFAALVQLMVLPVEWDASFRRALPLLKAGEYLPEQDLPAARSLLTAAAFTYFAAALLQIVNLRAWLSLLRR